MKTLKDLLIEFNACEPARDWAKNMSIEEVVKTCERGDWLLWLGKRIDLPLKELTLAKGHCAATVLHLMKDDRSKAAVKAAIDFGNGKITRKELATYAACASSAAASAAYAASFSAAVAAAFSADAAADAAAADAAVAFYAASASACASSASAASAARKNNQLATAEICRKYIGDLIIFKINELLK